MEHVLQQGAPEVVPSGARFALDIYGLESTLDMEGEAGTIEDHRGSVLSDVLKLQTKALGWGSIHIYSYLFISIHIYALFVSIHLQRCLLHIRCV